MSQTKAKKVIVLALLIGGVTAVARKAKLNEWDAVPRILVGQVIAAFLLSILAEFKPEVAGPFAVLVLVTVILEPDVADLILGSLGAKK